MFIYTVSRVYGLHYILYSTWYFLALTDEIKINVFIIKTSCWFVANQSLNILRIQYVLTVAFWCNENVRQSHLSTDTPTTTYPSSGGPPRCTVSEPG